MEETTEYRVRSDRMPIAEDRFKRLAKRAAKLGVPAPTFKVVREESVPMKRRDRMFDAVELGYDAPEWTVCSEDEAERHERWFVITVDGEAPVLPGGWKLAGTIQHTTEGNALRMTEEFNGDATAYRTGVPQCDQCKTVRNRRDTYLVVRPDDGKLFQVGSNCIKDFLGHESPERAIAYAEALYDLLSDLDSESEYAGNGPRDRESVNLSDLLEETIAAIDTFGWLSRGNARKMGRDGEATADIALSNLFTLNPRDRSCEFPTDEQKQEADAVLTFARDRFEDRGNDLNDYEWNLSVAIRRTWVEPRESGLVASVVFYVRREQEKELKKREFAKKNEKSEWQGALKQRLRGLRLQFTFVREWEGDFGVVNFCKFQDADGNLYEWAASRGEGWMDRPGTWLTVTGTVKEHSEYNGVKTTKLNRCVCEEVPDVPQ